MKRLLALIAVAAALALAGHGGGSASASSSGQTPATQWIAAQTRHDLAEACYSMYSELPRYTSMFKADFERSSPNAPAGSFDALVAYCQAHPQPNPPR